MQTIAIIDYGSGNLRSAERAVLEAAARAGLSSAVTVTRDAELVRQADRIILPGVGAFADCMRGVTSIPGMLEALEETVRQKGRPFLGICVGMQLMAERGLEHGEHNGLGWIKGDVVELKPADSSLKIPHMGWNAVNPAKASALFPNPGDPVEEFYFVHSYVLQPADKSVIAASTRHGIDFCSAICSNNLAGVQFHPEKSQRAGLALLARFLEWRP
ncbi:MAG: imidazole glycerol phosphate synthase subunit HisH [Caulobacterales bacterium]